MPAAPRRFRLPPLDQLEAFEAAARHLSFTRAADELCLSQSAVSRQVAALEAHYGRPLFQRLHRALRLTDDGQRLQQVVDEVLVRLHDTGAELRRAAATRAVAVATTPGFAGLWLIPRLARFTAARPDLDVRLSAGNEVVDLERDGIDLAIRYLHGDRAGPAAQRLFGELVFPVCSPRLLRDPARPLRSLDDLRRHVLLQKDADAPDSLSLWSTWLGRVGQPALQPASMMRFTMYDQLMQAAVDAQGVALARSPLVDDLLRTRRLVAPFPQTLPSAHGYYVLLSAAGARKPEAVAFAQWLAAEAAGPGEAVAQADAA